MSGRFRGAASLVVSLLCVQAIAAPAARAEDITSAVYKDVETVVIDLITREAAHGIVPAAACLAPGLERYFPRSLQRIYDLQFGGLKASLQVEAASIAAYLVYRAIKDPPRRDLGGLFVPRDRAPATPNHRAAGAYASQSANVTRGTNPYPIARIDPGDAVTKPTLEQCADDLRKKFANGDFASGTQDADGNPVDAVGVFDAACRAPRSPAELFACSVGTTAQSILLQDAAAARASLLRAAFVIALQPLVAGKVIEAERVVELVPLLAGAVMAAAQAETDPIEAFAKVLEPKVKLADLKNNYGGVVELVAQVVALLNAGSLSKTFESFIAVALGDQGLFAKVCNDAAPCSDNLSSLVKFAAKLAKELWPIVKAITDRQARDAALAAVNELFQDCSEGPKDGTVLSRSPESGCDQRAKYKRFVVSVVSYVADAESAASVSAATSKAFRDAAEDLVESVGKAGGIDRTRWERIYLFGDLWLPLPTLSLVAPQLTLSYAWSPGFVTQSVSGNGRAYVSIDSLNLIRYPYFRTQFVYWDLRLWLIDLVGPFSEIALRRNDLDYKNAGEAWWLFIKPKLSMTLASPLVSKHLGASLYLGLRPAAVFGDSTQAPRYQRIWDDIPGVSNPFYRFLEVGISAVYLL